MKKRAAANRAWALMNSRLQATVPGNAVRPSCPPIRDNQKKKKKKIALPRRICCLAAYLEAPTRPSSIHVSSTCLVGWPLHSTALTPTAAFWRSAGRRESCELATAMRCQRPPWLKKWSGDRCAHMAKDLLFWVGCTCSCFELQLASTRRPPVERIGSGSGTGTWLQATSHPVQQEADSLNKV
jgi:hypothetical protein